MIKALILGTLEVHIWINDAVGSFGSFSKALVGRMVMLKVSASTLTSNFEMKATYQTKRRALKEPLKHLSSGPLTPADPPMAQGTT